MRPSAGSFVDEVGVKTGDRVDVFWKGPEDTRSLPDEVLSVEHGAFVRWRVQITGPAGGIQRRAAVRGRVKVEVEAGLGAVELKGETVDVSENRLRANFEGFGMP